ncbi:hypothetical protein J6590_081885 [Homalodisca vitripennis]|nr:hypothetical protein J6590_081885 [Homalodisca vitripennis]
MIRSGLNHSPSLVQSPCSLATVIPLSSQCAAMVFTTKLWRSTRSRLPEMQSPRTCRRVYGQVLVRSFCASINWLGRRADWLRSQWFPKVSSLNALRLQTGPD